ncbi:PAS domain S-box protein [Propionivibrio dicarboxylicus]|uniref:Sensory/regulatory protein RpfC n=1 Tax=Propionivibrio dicarboxylicus TaxID=83767 RepID=A0A1G8AD54_9RHOO|nr:PAS domain S-box protein [Propionivibrio dicarboxylicus]SDH18945.1 PAS domain S-box-containing protein [Propionivibrio dicarboxylicus]
MKPEKLKLLPYLKVFFLPAVLIALLTGAFNLLSFDRLHEDHLAVGAQSMQDLERINTVTAFNQNVAATQHQVTELLDAVSAGRIDAANAYRQRTALIKRLPELEQAFEGLRQFEDEQNYLKAKEDFAAYKRFILEATDLAVVEPRSALHSAYLAANRYLYLSEHTRDIVRGVTDRSLARNEAREQAFHAHAVQNMLISGILIVALMAVWFLLIHRLSTRLMTVGAALDGLSRGEVDPQTLPGVERMAAQKSSMLQGLAAAVLVFRETMLVRRQAEYDLGERIKEITCLYDVTRLTEDTHAPLDEVLEEVARRLPAAMRYPEIAIGCVDFHGVRYGALPNGERLAVPIGAMPDSRDQIAITYVGPLPADAGAAFLDEERALFETLANRLASVLERRQTQQALTKAHRALSTANRCSQTLIHAQSEPQLIDDFCRLSVDAGGYPMAWFGLLPDETPEEALEKVPQGAGTTLHSVVAYGAGSDRSETAALFGDGRIFGLEPARVALRESRTVIVQDTDIDPMFAPWRDAARQRGYRAVIALPLRDEAGACFGVFNLCAAEHDAFDREEVALLESLVDDLAYGIRNMRLQQAMRDNHALTQAVIDQAPDAIELTDPTTLRFLDANEASCRMLGYTREEHLAQTVSDIQVVLAPDELAAVQQQIIATGMSTFETHHRRKDGSLIDVRVTVRLLMQHDRDYFLAIWRDISEEKRAQAELRKLSLVVEQSPNPVVISDLDSRIEYVNPAFTRITGYTREEVVGQTPRILKSGKTPDSVYRDMWAALLRGEPWKGEFINHTRDGKEFVESAHVIPLRQADGKITNYVAVKEDITAAKRQEDQLRKLFLAVEQSPESIVITDLDARIEYVNEAFVRNTGYSREEACGLNPRVLKSGHTPSATYESMWESLSNGRPWRGELINLRKDGSEYVEFANIAPVRQEDGRITHFLAIKEDITEKKRMSDELERHREHLEALVETRTGELHAALREQNALFEAASTGIVLLIDRTIVRCNRRMDEIFGYDDGEQIGRSTRIWYADSGAYERVGDEIYPIVAQGRIDIREMPLIRKDGTPIWCRVSSRAIDIGDSGKGLVVIFEDITAEREAAEALRMAHEELRAIFDSATVGIVLTTRARIILRCNRRQEEIFGYGPGEFDGRPTRLWFPDEASYALGGGSVYDQMAHGETHTREQQMVRKDGSPVWVRITSRLLDPHDPESCALGIFEDISVERAAMEEMKNARALAEAAAQMRSDFLANMSHEIRTPMNAIIGMAHLAMKTELTSPQRDYLRKIQISSQHLLGIINDILDLSKIEAGKMVVEKIEFDLDRVFENVASLLSEKAAMQGLEFIIDVDDDIPRNLVGDPLRIGQILINYANNALKFTEHGEIAVRATVLERSSDAVLLNFSVTDTGIGLNEEQRGRLFKSFEQGDTSTTRKYGGTGLGLAICRQLAELMGGRVGVDSDLGRGSSFWFEIRLPVGTGKARILLPEPDLRNRHVLVVDDNAHARNVAVEMLQSMTFVAVAVDSGREAAAEILRASAEGHPYEIVFLDWQMPEMDGVATARKIRELNSVTQPHLVMVTAYGRDEVMKLSAEVGIEDVLIKPVTPSLIFDAVMRVLGAPRLEERSAPQPDDDPGASEFAGIRALVVEDNDLNQEVAYELLASIGFVVDIAENGAVACAQLEAALAGPEPYDIVFMDVQMPVMDGYEATRRIRQLPQCAELPIVAMTANAMSGDRERCLESGMNDHIAKPIDPDDLLDKVRRWTRRLGQAAPVEVSAAPQAPVVVAAPAAASSPIKGIDFEAGLRHAMGRRDLYESLLARFVAGQTRFAEQMEAALAQADWALAERLAHTLKGVSAQIGAPEIRADAERFEAEIRQRRPVEALQAALAAIDGKLDALLAAIRAILPERAAPAVGAEVDEVQLREVCRQLVRRLERDDFTSGSLVDANETLLRAAMGAAYPPFAEAVSNYDFSAALSQLLDFVSRVGEDLG